MLNTLRTAWSERLRRRPQGPGPPTTGNRVSYFFGGGWRTMSGHRLVPDMVSTLPTL
jgi:hypothetical protein